jgi:hypothetical protein
VRSHLAISRSIFRRQGPDQLQAHDLLAPLCGWFTEGMKTGAVEDAKLVLAELR